MKAYVRDTVYQQTVSKKVILTPSPISHLECLSKFVAIFSVDNYILGVIRMTVVDKKELQLDFSTYQHHFLRMGQMKSTVVECV
jgi:hypothetical protein